MKQFSLAVVGPGLIGLKHIELINKHPECFLAAIVAPDHEHDRKIAAQLHVPLFHFVEDLLRTTRVDGVIISSPNVFHVAQAMTCIKSDIPVLIEKPIAHTVEEGLVLLDLIEKKSAKVIVGHHRAHSPIISTAKSIIEQQRLGRIVAIMGSALFYKPTDYFDTGKWRKEIGGGPILINLIHEIGTYRTLCGEIAAVQAITSNAMRNFVVEDTVAINFQFVNGALGTFLLSDTAASFKSWEQTSNENPRYPNYPQEDCYTVSGTLGSLAIPTMQLNTYPVAGQQSWWKPFETETIPVERKDPLACQLAHFLKVIEGSAKPVVSAYDGLQNLKVTEAIQKSARSHSVVYL